MSMSTNLTALPAKAANLQTTGSRFHGENIATTTADEKTDSSTIVGKAPSIYDIEPTEIYLEDFSGFQRWLKFCQERIQLPVYTIVSVGVALSGYYLLSDSPSTPPTIYKIIWGVLTMILLFTTLRLMDDHKDWQTDIAAHPERPIPRGLVTPNEVSRAIWSLLFLLLLNSLCIFLFVSHAAGITLFGCIVFQFLMWKEFFIPHLIDPYPLLYAMLHQPITAFWFVFLTAMSWDSNAITTTNVWIIGFSIVGATFSYEVARKLDPLAHPALGTYLVTYGRDITALLVIVFNVGAGALAWKSKVGIELLVWPVEGLTILATLFVLYCTKNSVPPVITRRQQRKARANAIHVGAKEVGKNGHAEKEKKEENVEKVDGEVTREDLLNMIDRGEMKKPKAFKYVELIATISCLMHYYAVAIKAWGGVRSL
ncbi:hypothetical protein HDU76_005702 [Blyttiomyces sp. JEL0837]|nr:hypothetical protein HDU76_005702 [Blyttiomyces sp. JEL0837]